MSRFLLSTFGSLGDLHPYIAIAKELLERGHATVIATHEEYREKVTVVGAEFVALPPSMTEFGDYKALVRRLFDPRRGPEYLLRDLVFPYLRSTYARIERAALGADLLVSHTLSFTIPLVAQKHRRPWVSTVLAPLSLFSCFDPPAPAAAPWLANLRVLGPGFTRMLRKLIRRSLWHWEQPLRDFRAELGLPPSSAMAIFEGQFSPLANLLLFDPVLAQPQPDWPPHSRVCGSPLFDDADGDPEALAELERFLAAGAPPIVFALGSSVVWLAESFWEHAVAAATALGRRAILVTGALDRRHLPAGIQAFSYLPYSKVFPRAAAVVHQAGIGTLAQALRSGRPQLIVPVAFDQPDNALRAARLGNARILPFQRIDTPRLTQELAILLKDDRYQAAAMRVARTLDNIDGSRAAAEALEGYVNLETAIDRGSSRWRP